MMKKIKSNPWMRSKALYVIPVAALALSAFATPKFVAPIEETVSKLEGKGTENSLNLQAFEEEKEKSTTMRVRGTGNAQPLIVLNDQIYEIPEDMKNVNLEREEQFTKLLNVNPEDVESITVLQKDAATAKWGDKGSNGVIVIKTKEAPKVVVDGKEMTPHEAIKAVQGKEIKNNLTTLPDGSSVLSIETKAAEAKEDSIYNVVHENAKYPGGDGECFKFLAQNIRYPKLCQEFGFEGRVIINFVVEKDGSLTNIKKVRGPGKELSEIEVTAYQKEHPDNQEKLEAGQDLGDLLFKEGERVLKMMPKWTPAKDKDGNIVRSRFALPIMFRLNKPAE